MTADPTYDYEFSIWPASGTPARYSLYKQAFARVVMTFAPGDFALFSDQLAQDGITLREVTRVPHHEPENCG
jgi:hypothetical protein